MAELKKNFKNISLTGFMGSGKTTVGKILADKTGYRYIDIDKVIEITERMKISEIFKKKGEKYFRDVENEVIEKLYINEACVFSCGGGVVLREDNMKIIKASSIVVFLSVKAENVIDRLKDVDDRPLLQKKDRKIIIEEMLKSRLPLYKKYADVVAETDICSPEDIASYIEKSIKN